MAGTRLAYHPASLRFGLPPGPPRLRRIPSTPDVSGRLGLGLGLVRGGSGVAGTRLAYHPASLRFGLPPGPPRLRRVPATPDVSGRLGLGLGLCAVGPAWLGPGLPTIRPRFASASRQARHGCAGSQPPRTSLVGWGWGCVRGGSGVAETRLAYHPASLRFGLPPGPPRLRRVPATPDASGFAWVLGWAGSCGSFGCGWDLACLPSALASLRPPARPATAAPGPIHLGHRRLERMD